MDILIGLTMLIFLPLAIVAAMHYWIGSYPEPFHKSIDTRNEIAEVIIFWLLAMAVSSIFILQQAPADLEFATANLQLRHMLYAVIPWLILPLAYVVFHQKWRARDLGFVLPRSWPMIIFALLLFGLIGIQPIFGDAPEPLPWTFLAIAVYQPAFVEEFFFRVILQGKLERALGQNRAWFYSGILFGLIHVPVDFFGPQFYANGENYLNASLLVLSQIIAGWIFGIIYSKTRSIMPGMLAHYFTDFRLGSIILHLTQ